VILLTVVYKEAKTFGDGWDGESQHDAKRCVDALVKRFEGCHFFHKQWKPGSWTVEAQPTTTRVTINEMKLFAEGFMASAFLWER